MPAILGTRRFLKVGQPGDCGRDAGGKFGGSNICSSGRRRDELDEDARIRSKKWIRSPAGRAAIEAAEHPNPRQTIGPIRKILESMGIHADTEELSKVVAVYRAVVGESRSFAKRLGGDPDAAFKAMAPLDASILKWLAASGHVKSLPPLLGSIPIGALTYLIFADKPSLRTVHRAKKMVKLTMKRVKTGSAGKEGKVTYRRVARFRRSVEIKKEDIKRAAKRIEKYGDAYFAMLAIALDRTSGDMNDSVRIADHAYKGETGGMAGDDPKGDKPSRDSRRSRRSRYWRPAWNPKHWRPGRVRAGSLLDCGHDPWSGHFDAGNYCWSIGQKLGTMEKKLGVGIDKARPQPKNKLDYIKESIHRVDRLSSAEAATPKIKGRLAKVRDFLKAAYHRLFRGKDANPQMKQAADLLKMGSPSKHRRHRYSHGGEGCGWEESSGRFVDENECQEGGKPSDSWEESKAQARRDLAAQEGRKAGKRHSPRPSPTSSSAPPGRHKGRSHEERYHDIGRALQAIPESQRRGSFGNRAFIQHLWDRYKEIDPGASRDAFVRDLLDLAGDRKIALHRHDMPQTLSREEREIAAASAIRPFGDGHGRPEFHTVEIPSRHLASQTESRYNRHHRSRYKDEHPDAGSAADCGHRDVSGNFDDGNDCAKGGGIRVAAGGKPQRRLDPAPSVKPRGSESESGAKTGTEVAPLPLGGLSPESTKQGGKDIDRLIHRFRQADLTDAAEAAKLLGKEVPEYLKAVQGFIDEQGMKFRKGELKPRDIAKAWGITVASQGASGMRLENIYDKMPDSEFMKWLAGSNRKRLVAELESHSAGGTCGPRGCKGRVSNAGIVRPEDLAAAWFISPPGEKALRKIDAGDFDPADWKELAMLRNVMGDDRFKSTGVFSPSVRNKKGDLVWIGKSKKAGKDVLRGRVGFADIPEVTKMINGIGKSSKGKSGADADKLTPLVMTLRGIKEGKAGFISHFFGVPDRPTYDAVQLNYWLTGSASINKMKTSRNKLQASELMKEVKRDRLDKDSVKLAMDLKKSLGSQQLRQEVVGRLEGRLDQLHKILKRKNKGLTLHILHHWLWDKAKGSMTTHSVVYKAMRAMKNISKYLRSRRRPARYTPALTGPAELPACFSDPKLHSMRVAPPKFLSREQVGEILAGQHFRRFDKNGKPRPNPKSADELEHMFCASTLYHLTRLPAWVARTYRKDPIPPGDHSHSTGPIIVDLLKDEAFRDKYPHGSFGFDPDVAVLDGNHRLEEHKHQFGDDSYIDAYIGTDAISGIRDWISDFGHKRSAFISALNDFYADIDEPSWDRLIEAGKSVGLSDRQIYGIWTSLKSGQRYNPTLGHFVSVNA